MYKRIFALRLGLLSTINLSLLLIISLFFAATSFAELAAPRLGQTLQIHTQLHSFLGKPQWLIVLRDIDHGQNIPYLFDVQRTNNYWMALTYSRNYLITVSQLQIETYDEKNNRFHHFTLENFCGLESRGRIIHGRSMLINIRGQLSADPRTAQCDVAYYAD